MKDKITYIVTIAIAVLTAVFTILKEQVWDGFVYFVFSLIMLLGFFWGGWLIYKYFTEYKSEIAEKYKVFKAEKINKLRITSDVYMAGEEAYKKEFKRKLFKEKFIKWFMICFCFAIAAAFLVAIIFY